MIEWLKSPMLDCVIYICLLSSAVVYFLIGTIKETLHERTRSN